MDKSVELVEVEGHQFEPMTIFEMRDYIQSHPWRTAKATANPHAYTLRKQAQNETDFERFVLTIRHLGYEVWFWRKRYICLDVDGMRYWSMGAPLHETILINRAVNE